MARGPPQPRGTRYPRRLPPRARVAAALTLLWCRAGGAVPLVFYNAFPSAGTVCFDYGPAANALTKRTAALAYRDSAGASLELGAATAVFIRAVPGCSGSGRPVLSFSAASGFANTVGWAPCSQAVSGAAICSADGAAGEVVLGSAAGGTEVRNGSSRLHFVHLAQGTRPCTLLAGPSPTRLTQVGVLQPGRGIEATDTCANLLRDGWTGAVSFECPPQSAAAGGQNTTIAAIVDLARVLCMGGSTLVALVGDLAAAARPLSVWVLQGAPSGCPGHSCGANLLSGAPCAAPAVAAALGAAAVALL